MRTIPDICQQLQKLDHWIKKGFIPAFIDEHITSSIRRKLLLLPVKVGGMGIIIFADVAKME